MSFVFLDMVGNPFINWKSEIIFSIEVGNNLPNREIFYLKRKHERHYNTSGEIPLANVSFIFGRRTNTIPIHTYSPISVL